MKLEIGKYYTTRRGHLVHITRMDTPFFVGTFEDNTTLKYTSQGYVSNRGFSSDDDIISEFSSGLNAFKLFVDNPEHVADVQEKLFEMGYFWLFHSKHLRKNIDSIELPFCVFTDNNGKMWSSSSVKEFMLDTRPEYEFEVVLKREVSMKLKEQPLIEIDGKRYLKSQVVQLLQQLDSIVDATGD